VRIALLAPAWFAVPPVRYGGIEWVVSHLADGLVERGHDVTLFAAGDSKTKAKLVTSYDEPPSDMKMADFMNYNKVFPGHQTAMTNPFIAGDGLVKYDDGTPATVDNYVRDVVAFLSWAADPTLEERKRLGLLVMGYLLITAVLFGFAKRRIWREVH